MVEIIIIAIVAALASLLTFFSGFGLGTILTPVLIIFFPVEVAITLTGIVHLLNNLFKMLLVYKQINWKVGIKFGAAAVIGAFTGAELLLFFSNIEPVYTYNFFNKTCSITVTKLIISVLMIAFVLLEAVPAFEKIKFDENKLYVGGLMSGFFGGLSGNQGALRSMFLLRCGLTKESFIATGVLIASVVDITRLSVYFNRLPDLNIEDNKVVLTIAVLSAFAGAFIGSKLLKKITMSFVQKTVTVMIIVLAIGLGTGII